MLEIFTERIHKVYILNTDVTFMRVYSRLEKFIPERTREKIHFADYTMLKQDIEVRNLPVCFGGFNFTEGDMLNSMPAI